MIYLGIVVLLAVSLAMFGEDSVGSVYHDGTNLCVRFTNAPAHFMLECSTNLADTNWVQLSEHKRIKESSQRWRTFVYTIDNLDNMEYWRLRDCATP